MQTGSGTGWVLDRDQRLVVTNAHVVPEIDEARVYFPIKKGDTVQTDPNWYKTNATCGPRSHHRSRSGPRPGAIAVGYIAGECVGSAAGCWSRQEGSGDRDRRRLHAFGRVPFRGVSDNDHFFNFFNCSSICFFSRSSLDMRILSESFGEKRYCTSRVNTANAVVPRRPHADPMKP